jgi:hypothetical protein
MLLRVPEGRHNVAHSACPERREGEVVGNKADKHKKAPAGAALRAHAPNVAQHPNCISTLGRDHIALEMRQRFSDRCFNSVAIPIYFANEHSALNRGDAKIGHSLFVGLLGKPSLGFFFDEERSEFILYNFEDQAEVLAGQFVVFGHFVSHGSKWSAASHLKTLLQFDLCAEPLLQILPGVDFIANWRAACLDLLQICLKHLVYEAFLAFEIVIKLALPGPGGFNDFVRAGGAKSLFVKQVRSSPNDAKSGLRAPRESRFHRPLHLYLLVQSRTWLRAESSRD